MDMMEIRRRVLLGSWKKSDELYPIGTNLYQGLTFLRNRDIDKSTGELKETGTRAVSDFIEVDMSYEYTKSYRLYGVFNYDENYSYLGYQGEINNLGTSVIGGFISGTKYIRTSVHENYVSGGKIINPSCKLVRTA